MEVIRNHERALDLISGTHKVGSLDKVTYWDIVNVLGSPTFDEASGDDKVQKEWIVEHNGEVFTIYDWKTYDQEYTVSKLTTWSIGGRSNPQDFETTLLKEIYSQKAI